MIDQGISLWEFVPLEQFSAPTLQLHKSIHTKWKGFKQLLFKSSKKKETQVKKVIDIINQHSDQSVNVLQWNATQAVSALNEALMQWFNLEILSPKVQVVVGAPYSRIAEIITIYAGQHWAIINHPTYSEILDGGAQWFQRQFYPYCKDPIAIPRLEKFYLRHPDGLALLCRVLGAMHESQGKCLIGCDSWSWAYLNAAIQIKLVCPSPFTMAPFDKEKMTQWLIDELKDAEDFLNQHSYMEQISVLSRGNPGIAWAIWHYLKATNQICKFERNDNCSNTTDILDLPRFSLPELPAGSGKVDAIALQTILIHGGISLESLSNTLVIFSNELMSSIRRLENARLIECQGDILYVTAPGYPAIREFLAHSGFFIDSL